MRELDAPADETTVAEHYPDSLTLVVVRGEYAVGNALYEQGEAIPRDAVTVAEFTAAGARTLSLVTETGFSKFGADTSELGYDRAQAIRQAATAEGEPVNGGGTSRFGGEAAEGD